MAYLKTLAVAPKQIIKWYDRMHKDGRSALPRAVRHFLLRKSEETRSTATHVAAVGLTRGSRLVWTPNEVSQDLYYRLTANFGTVALPLPSRSFPKCHSTFVLPSAILRASCIFLNCSLDVGLSKPRRSFHRLKSTLLREHNVQIVLVFSAFTERGTGLCLE